MNNKTPLSLLSFNKFQRFQELCTLNRNESQICINHNITVKSQSVSCSVVSDSLGPRGAMAHQAPLSMGFSRQEHWSGFPIPSPGDLPNPGIKPRSPTLQADSLPPESPGKSKNTGMGSLSLLQGYDSSPLQSSCIQVDPSLEIYLKTCQGASKDSVPKQSLL